MKNRLLALEQSLLENAPPQFAEAKGYATQFGGSATTKAILAQLPDWMKDKIGMNPSGEIEFERNIYDTTSLVIWSRAQVAIDRMQSGTYTIFGARTVNPQSPQNPNHDKFSTSQILIMLPKQVKTVEINFVKRFQDLSSFEQGLIDAGIPVRKGGFTNYSKNYWDWMLKMYSPQFSVAQGSQLPPEVKFMGRDKTPYIEVQPQPKYLYLSDEMIQNLQGLRGEEHNVPISMIIEAANNALRRNPDEPGSSDAFFYAIEGSPKHLVLVLSKRRDNLMTAYFLSKSQIMNKLGLDSETKYAMRFRDRKKLVMPI